jgi:hypothetical protein
MELELGLDITLLLGMIEPGESTLFNLIVDHHREISWGSGSITQFSVIDYTNGISETTSVEQNVPITDNSQTTLSLLKTIDFEPLRIINESLPKVDSGIFYAEQLENSGGEPPFTWHIVQHYGESNNLGYYPQINQEKLEFPDTILARTFKKLEFDFPFYGKTYDSVWVHTSGFIMFDDQDYPWPYLFDEALMIKQTRNISPMLNRWFYIDDADNDGVWYEGDENVAAFRWKVSSNKSGEYDMNFSLMLFPDGNIVFNYKQDNDFQFNYWAAGFSDGDQINYKIASSIDDSPTETQVVGFEPTYFPEEMNLTKSGYFSGTPKHNYVNVPIEFQLTDKQNITVRKTLNFTSNESGFVDSTVSDLNFKVFPNPSGRLFFIETNFTDSSGIKFQLINSYGQILSEITKYDLLFSIDMYKAAQGKSGIYYLKSIDPQGKTSVNKLVYSHY